MSKLLLFGLLFCSSIFITCCKKKQYAVRYPEDPEYTYLTPPERLCDKWWILDSVSLNGMDYTDTVDLYIGDYKFFIDSKEFDINGFSSNYRNGVVETDKFYPQVGFITFFEGTYSALQFHLNVQPFMSDTVISFAPYLYHPYTSIWKILKLSESSLKITIQHKDTILINYYKMK